MAKQLINLGNPNVGNGDPLRTAFEKVNANFAELYSGGIDGASITASTTPPTNPSVGALWYDETGGRMYVFFDNTWVDTNPNSIVTDRLVHNSAALVLDVGVQHNPHVTFPAFNGEYFVTQGTELSAFGASATVSSVHESVIVSANIAGTRKDWTFGSDGALNLPVSTASGTPSIVQSTHDIKLLSNTASLTIGTDGTLTLPTQNLGSGLAEATVLSSQRKVIPAGHWSAILDHNTPTVVYRATSEQISSIKVIVQVQHGGIGVEMFEVLATYTNSDVYYSVSNRIKPPQISNTAVLVDSGTDPNFGLQITLTITSGAQVSWVTYDAIEFGIASI